MPLLGSITVGNRYYKLAMFERCGNFDRDVAKVFQIGVEWNEEFCGRYFFIGWLLSEEECF